MEGSSGGGAQDQVADDLGSSTTGQGALGIEGAVSIAADDADGGHHVDSFSIVDGAVIGEVLGAGADGDQRHGHNQSQNQRKELLHGVFLLGDSVGHISFAGLIILDIVVLSSPRH